MKNKIFTVAMVLGVALTALVVVGPVLAHPYWENEEGEQIYLPWWGEYGENYTMPHWDLNGTYPMSYWYENGNQTYPYWNEDGTYCPGPYWATPDGEAPEGSPDQAPPVYPRRGYGCGGYGGIMGGLWGSRGGFSSYSRGSMGWSG
ncbi:MAG: hypothetical protein NWE89_11080 [Candidatus Bathyarchaeota archaeon]|nr:hypothetical protein [Candidatus Bathyarchaeota archaeon]